MIYSYESNFSVNSSSEGYKTYEDLIGYRLN